MVTRKDELGIIVRQVMVRLPEESANALELEAKSKGTTLAAYCRELLVDHLKHRGNREDIAPVVKETLYELLNSDELNEEFGKKVAKSMSKLYN